MIGRHLAPLGLLAALALALLCAAVSVAYRRTHPPVPPYRLVRADPSVVLGSHPVFRGDAGARYSLVEFADYQCPTCIAIHAKVTALVRRLGPSVRFAFRNYPLPIHRGARAAAIAAEDGGLQGRFWQMHDALMEQHGRLGQSDVEAAARAVIPDLTRFNQDADIAAARVDADIKDAARLDVVATPTFFLVGPGPRIVRLGSLAQLREVLRGSEGGGGQ